MRQDERERRRRRREEGEREFEALCARLAPCAFDDLVTLSEEGAEDERAAAIRIIGDYSDSDRVVPILIHALETTESPFVRWQAAVGLEAHADQRAYEPLLRHIKRLHPLEQSGVLLWAFGSLDTRDAVVELCQILCESGVNRYHPAWTATSAITSMKGPVSAEKRHEALTLLRTCLQREDLTAWQAQGMKDALRHIERLPEL